MRKVGLLMMLLALTGLLFSCSNGDSPEVVGEVETNTERSMSMTYEKFDGRKQAGESIRVAPGEEVVVRVDVVTEGGSLTVYIAPESDPKDYVLESHDLPTSQFTVTLSEVGNYIVQVEAKDHKGSYNIDW